MGGLWSIINQECRILTTLTHIQSAEVKRAFNATTFIKNDRQRLFNTSCDDFHGLWGLAGPSHTDFDFFIYAFSVCSS